jgi:hypothetical protein
MREKEKEKKKLTSTKLGHQLRNTLYQQENEMMTLLMT